MFKPLTRANQNTPRSNGDFAETTLLHAAGDDDYSGFAPTEMSELDDVVPAMPQSWITSQWVAAQEAKAHEAAAQARAVIAAQRRADHEADVAHAHAHAPAHEPAHGVLPAPPRSGLARVRAAFGRLSLLPLFIGVTVTVALISAVLPLVDRH